MKVLETPIAIESEAAVLGAMISDPNGVIFVSDVISPIDFYVPVHRWLADAIWSCFEQRVPPTMAAIIHQLGVAGRWSETGTSKIAASMKDIDAVLNSIAQPDIEFVLNNAALIRDAAFRRTGYSVAQQAASTFYNRSLTMDVVQADVLTMIGKVFERNDQRSASIQSIAVDEKKRLDSMVDGQLPGVSCGVRWLDEVTGGFLPAETWVIAAPYKMRKTTLELNMALACGLANVPVSIFTIGDSSRDATYRKLTAMRMNQLALHDVSHKTASSQTLQYNLKDEYYIALRNRAWSDIDQMPIRLYDAKDRVGTLSEATRNLRRDVALYGTRVFFYDYAQAINFGANDYEKTTYFAAWLQTMVGEHGLTGVAISQLNEQAIGSDGSSYSPGAKGGGALPAAANVFLMTKYAEPTMTVELKLSRDSAMGQKIQHKLNPASGLILDAMGQVNL